MIYRNKKDVTAILRGGKNIVAIYRDGFCVWSLTKKTPENEQRNTEK